MTSRDDRVAANETIFRDANESIRRQAGNLALDSSNPVPFLCECADMSCTQVILLTLDDYEAVRASSHTFAVVPGHVAAGSETVVGEQRDATPFAVVEKTPPGQEITETTDPRR